MKGSLGENPSADDLAGVSICGKIARRGGWQANSSSFGCSLSGSKNVSTGERYANRQIRQVQPLSVAFGDFACSQLIRQNVNLALYGASKKSERVISEVRTGERRDSLARSVTPISVSRTIDFGGDRDRGGSDE